MTTRTVYVPRQIESAEQAEALPVGTIAILDDDSLPVSLNVTKTAEYLMPWRNGRNVGADENVVGAWALVPIEAEEEWTAMGSDHGEPWIAHVGHDGIDGSREEAQQYVDRFGGFIAHRTRTPWEEAQ